MMKSYRIVWTLYLVCVLVALTVIGCSGNGNHAVTEPREGTGQAGNDGNQSGELQMVDGKYVPEVTMTTVRSINPGGVMVFRDGEDIDNNVHYKWIRDTLGIKVNNLWSVMNANGAYDIKLRLALSSNQKMPDMLVAYGAVAHELINSGKFMEVGPLWDKYASQTWKEAMSEDPNVWHQYTVDGKRMAIPVLSAAYGNDAIMWINSGWLEKVNMGVPKTIEELEAVMDAFVNQDPDNNGKKDTYALAVAMRGELAHPVLGVSWVFGAYGVLPGQWNLINDGSIGYGSVQPEIKKGLAKLKEWVAKGYINKEAGIWDQSKAGEDMLAGNTGITSGPTWLHTWPLGDFEKNRGAKLKVFGLPTGPDGIAKRPASSKSYGAILLNKDMKHPEIFFTYMNYMYEHQANPPIGGQFEYGWHEGYDWDMVNGKPVYNKADLPHYINVSFYGLTGGGAEIPSQFFKAISEYQQTGAAETPYARKFAELVPLIEQQAIVTVLEQENISSANVFTGPPTPTMKEKLEYLQKLEQETFSKIIYGNEPLEYFDEFVAQWKSLGGEQITKEVNEWYASVTK